MDTEPARVHRPANPRPVASPALPWEVRVSRRAPRNTLAQEVAGPVRAAFEPRYGRALGDDEVGEIADNFRRFYDVLAAWDAEDRAGLGPGGVRAANDPPPRSPDAPPEPAPVPPAHPEPPSPSAALGGRRR